MATVFAIRKEDALSWHDATWRQATIAERSGFRIRALKERRCWEIWATDIEFALLCEQAEEI